MWGLLHPGLENLTSLGCSKVVSQRSWAQRTTKSFCSRKQKQVVKSIVKSGEKQMIPVFLFLTLLRLFLHTKYTLRHTGQYILNYTQTGICNFCSQGRSVFLSH